MISIDFDKYTLPNGLQVILHEDHSLPMAAVNIWYHVGSKDEDQGRTGFAHLFEHVMFEGSKNHNELFFNPLMKVGGSVNGSTSSDRTNYWENVPSDYLELALWLESDRMGFLLEALDQKRLDLQRDVVKNERRQSYENRPYGTAYLLLQPALFPAPHPYSWPVIGSQEDLDAASLDDVKSFFRRFYSPSNATISIAGDIDPDATRGLVERYFGDIPPTPAVNRIGRMASTLSSETRLDFHDKVQLPRLYLVWPSTPAFDEDEAPLDVLGTVLADGKSSRLYRTLVYEKQIARSVSVYNHAMEVAGEFNVQVTASPGHGLDEIQDVVEEELDRIRSEPLSDRELERAKNRVESQHVRQLEQMGGFGGRADQLNYYNTFGGDPGMINTDLERFTGVQADDVRRAARRWLGSARVRMTVLPEQDKSATVSAVDRAVMPGGGEQKGFTPPRPERARLSNGTEVVFRRAERAAGGRVRPDAAGRIGGRPDGDPRPSTHDHVDACGGHDIAHEQRDRRRDGVPRFQAACGCGSGARLRVGRGANPALAEGFRHRGGRAQEPDVPGGGAGAGPEGAAGGPEADLG